MQIPRAIDGNSEFRLLQFEHGNHEFPPGRKTAISKMPNKSNLVTQMPNIVKNDKNTMIK